MDTGKMKAMAQAMNRLDAAWDAKLDEVVGLVKAGMLTADEASECLAGADLKEREAIREETGLQPGPGGDLYVARQAVDSRLPGYNGLAIGRHI